MKKIILFIFVVCTLASCSDKSDLDGVWMGAYQLHHREEGDAYSPLKLLFEFDGDSLHSKFFGSGDGSNGYQKTSAFQRKDGYILPKGNTAVMDSLKIVSITTDSLVFRLFSNYERDLVFKKVRSISKVKTDLLYGRSFTLQSGGLTDTLEFVNDSLFLHMRNLRNSTPVKNWKIDSYKNLNFIVLDLPNTVPMLIDTIQNSAINLRFFYKKIKNARLKPLPKKWDLSQLKGNWVCWDAVATGADLPQWVEEDANRGEYLYFSANNQLKRSLFGKEEHYSWKATGNHQGIYFPDKLNDGGIHAYWKILDLSSDRLLIERNQLQETEKLEKVYLEFHRTKY